MNPAASILIVEDEAIVALDLRHQLTDLGYEVTGTAASGEQAMRQLDRRVPDMILMDVRLQGDVDGIEVAAAIRQRHDIPVIFLTSHSDDDTVRRAANTAPYGYLTKPFQIRELRAGIEVALTKAQLERQLREADRWFAHTLLCVADGVVVTDAESRVRFLNPAAEKLTGWSLEEAQGRDVAEIVRLRPQPQTRPGVAAPALPAHRYEATAMIRSAMQLGRPTPVAYGLQLTARDASTRLVDETVGPVVDDRGRPLGAVLVLHDAGERVAQEALLRDSEERFRGAFDHAPLGMALVALSGALLQVNAAYCRLLNATPEALTAMNHADLGVEADREHESQRLRELVDGRLGVVQYERHYRRLHDGVRVPALVSASVLQEGGRPSCFLLQVHDLSAQKRAAEQLAELAEGRMKLQASELANATKNEFLSRVSHEMRTPLNAVIGFASLLQLREMAAGAGNDSYAHYIKAAGEQLLAMVTDLIDLNRVAEGTLTVTREPLRLASHVAQSLNMLQPLGRTHGVDVAATIDPALSVLADPVRLQQLLLNVVSNAIKYNRQGGRVRVSAALSEPGRVRVSVDDEGIGMTTLQLERLFQPFDRLGQEHTQTPGTGLGLVIARGLAMQMGGALEVTSQPGVGTTVRIDLPAAT